MDAERVYGFEPGPPGVRDDPGRGRAGRLVPLLAGEPEGLVRGMAHANKSPLEGLDLGPGLLDQVVPVDDVGFLAQLEQVLPDLAGVQVGQVGRRQVEALAEGGEELCVVDVGGLGVAFELVESGPEGVFVFLWASEFGSRFIRYMRSKAWGPATGSS